MITMFLSAPDRDFALHVARKRHGMYGPPAPARGRMKDLFRIDHIGALGEIAVCRFYGEDPRDQPAAWWGRPGREPDLILRGHTIAVKTTDRWSLPITMYLPSDDMSQIAMLVSVRPEAGECGLQGWITTRSAAERYPEVYEFGRMVRHIPCFDLRPCHAEGLVPA